MQLYRIIEKYDLLRVDYLAVVMTKFFNFVYNVEMISLFPFRTGDLIRNKFYKWTLIGFVKKVTINFETIIS